LYFLVFIIIYNIFAIKKMMKFIEIGNGEIVGDRKKEDKHLI
jgi:hypothetical protein